MQPDLATDIAASLSARHAGHEAEQVLAAAIAAPDLGRLTAVSSFGAESVVLLHMISRLKPDLPVLFIDTQMLFAETLDYQLTLARDLGLTGIKVIRASEALLQAQDPDDTLHQRNTDACCDLRKTRPLALGLAGYDSWITGRKRFQAETRADLPLFEAEGHRIKVNPLAHWNSARLRAYMEQHDLPPHPLVAQGYPSIGCMPCTTPVAAGEDARAGRWRGQAKEECGIHFINGKLTRGPIPLANPVANATQPLQKRA